MNIYLTYYNLEACSNSNSCILTNWYYDQEWHKYIYDNSSTVNIYRFELINKCKVVNNQNNDETLVLDKNVYKKEWDKISPSKIGSLMDYTRIECNMIRSNRTEITEKDFCNYALQTLASIPVNDQKYVDDYKAFIEAKIKILDDPSYEVVFSYEEVENEPIKISLLFDNVLGGVNFLEFDLKIEKGKIVKFNSISFEGLQALTLVYNKAIAKILLYVELVNNTPKGKNLFILHGIKLLDPNMVAIYYMKGVIKANKEWNNNYKIPLNQDPSNSYINRLKHLYFKQEINIGNIVPEKIFYGCSFVKELDFSKVSLKAIENIGYYTELTRSIDAFMDESGLNEIISLNEKSGQVYLTENVVEKKPKEKWYALLYWITLNSRGDSPPKTLEGTFDKKKLIQKGKEMSGRKGGGFYAEFVKIADWLNNDSLLNHNFPNWKPLIIKLSNNNNDIINYLKDKYNYEI